MPCGLPAEPSRVRDADLGPLRLDAPGGLAGGVVGGDPVRVVLVQEDRPHPASGRRPLADRARGGGRGEVVAFDHGGYVHGQPVAYDTQYGGLQGPGGGDLEFQHLLDGESRRVGDLVEVVEAGMLFRCGDLLYGADHIVELDHERPRLLGELGGGPALADTGRPAEQHYLPGRRPLRFRHGSDGIAR